MKVLFLHPEDVPWQSAWASERWDVIIDLGLASSYTYEEWGRRLDARVFSIQQFSGTESYRWLNQVLESGRGRLTDRLGLDWWEIVGAAFYKDLQLLYLFQRLRREIALDRMEIAATRPHPFERIISRTPGCSVRIFQSSGPRLTRRAGQMWRSARQLRAAQIAEVAFDKWDPCYGLRRHAFWQKRAKLIDPVVLLPSAYSNVTRSAVSYAAQLPHRRFLLATTRRSAVPERLPGNVQETTLAAYAVPFDVTRAEASELKNAWQVFLCTMACEAEEFRRASESGLWDHFPQHFEHGLRLRDAWKNLLDSEPVKGVLCGDDLNYYTRIPLILAYLKGLNSVYCSHGALDGGFLFKAPFADSFLVKGEMEGDYLTRKCGIEAERIRVGAPGKNPFADAQPPRDGALVFFSQPYEVAGGRMDELYREIIPRLCSVARSAGRKVIVKLHPFESVRARKALVASILPGEECAQVEIVSGMTPDEVIARTWCGVTIDSSVAVECALRNIPFFLCGWVDFGGMGYAQQFARFGVAQELKDPQAIERIPELVPACRRDAARTERLWHEADPVQLDEIMFGSREVRSPHPCAC